MSRGRALHDHARVMAAICWCISKNSAMLVMKLLRVRTVGWHVTATHRSRNLRRANDGVTMVSAREAIS